MDYLKAKYKTFVLLVVAVFLTACAAAPQQPTVSLNTKTLSKDELKVGIYYKTPKEKATTHISGAACLLCYGVAAALTSDLDTHLESSIKREDLSTIKNQVVAQYKEQFKNVELVQLPTSLDSFKKFEGELGFANKDFRELKSKLDIDVLVVLDLSRHGAFRSFSNYIPNGDPHGYVSGVLYSVDLETNAYIQYLEIDEKVQPSGAWDEPPMFPSVTTAYYQAIENTKQKLISSF